MGEEFGEVEGDTLLHTLISTTSWAT